MPEPRKTSVLITGCTPGGIGHALAVEFQNRGCHVIATARDPAILEELAAQGFSTSRLDVTNQESISQCKKEVEKLTGGRLDILVNNAGRTHTIPALDIDIDDVKATYDTNVFGPMAMIAHFISLLVAARGLVVNISSVSSHFPYLFGAIYSSTKGAIDVYSRALRLELQPLGVRVMVAMTGTVKSNIASRQHRSLPAGSYYEPVRDVFERRLVFSQNNSTISTESYAKRFVGVALRGEGWLGGWLGGTPNAFWYGGLSGAVWFAGFFPKRLVEGVASLYWGIAKMERRINAAKKQA